MRRGQDVVVKTVSIPIECDVSEGEIYVYIERVRTSPRRTWVIPISWSSTTEAK